MSSSHAPIGAVIAELQRAIDNRFDAALAGTFIVRRDWQLLATIARGESDVDALRVAIAAFLDPDEAVHPRLEALAARGLVSVDGDACVLTEEGRAEVERVGEIVDGIRRRLVDGLEPGEYGRTVATLQAMTRNLT